MRIGVDIAYIPRFKDVDEHFIKRILTNDEIIQYQKLSSEKRILFLAGRWASKEAIYKANNKNDYLHYTILNEENGKPYVKNHPEIKISISHDNDYVVAFVIEE